MQISSLGNTSYQVTAATDPLARNKQLFQKLGSALASGNLDAAKETLTQLQKNAPAQAEGETNPISEKMTAISQAVDSGDLKAARSAFKDLKTTLSHAPNPSATRPSGGRPAGGPPAGGPPPGGAPGGTKKSSGGTSTSNKTYDKKDTNQDGTVSEMEEFAYSLKHNVNTKSTTTPATPTDPTTDTTLGSALDIAA